MVSEPLVTITTRIRGAIHKHCITKNKQSQNPYLNIFIMKSHSWLEGYMLIFSSSIFEIH